MTDTTMKATPSRRAFLATTSTAIAAHLLGARTANARALPRNILTSSYSPEHWLPETMVAIDLQALATKAVDAAYSAGASYADIRVAEQQQVRITWAQEDTNTSLQSWFTFGIRVLSDGAWAFVHGTAPNINAVSDAAKNAVASARGFAKLNTHRVELAPVPPVTGEWTTPIEMDPFTVPLRDQGALLAAYGNAVKRVHYGVPQFSWGFCWTRETRVFASTEGSLATQKLYRSEPDFRVMAEVGMGDVRLFVPRLRVASGGYETVAIPGLQDEIKQYTEEAVGYAKLPRRAMDVGRYPLVLDGVTLGTLFGRTIGAALELDRALGDETDASGTSLLSPWDVPDTAVFSPALTASAHRAMPTIAAVRWDDEGVVARSFPVVAQGRVVSYFASREAAAKAGKMKNGMVLSPQGCMATLDAGDPAQIRAPYLTVAPDTQKNVSVEELCRNVERGLYIRDSRFFSVDQQLSSGMLKRGEMLAIVKGKIAHRVDGNAIQFNTIPFWKGLTQMGGAGTTRESVFYTHKGQPWHSMMQGVSAPAGLFKEVNVIATRPSW